jgi:hypothetical protein
METQFNFHKTFSKREQQNSHGTWTVLVLGNLHNVGLAAQAFQGWTPVNSIDFSPTDNVMIKSDDGSLTLMDVPLVQMTYAGCTITCDRQHIIE